MEEKGQAKLIRELRSRVAQLEHCSHDLNMRTDQLRQALKQVTELTESAKKQKEFIQALQAVLTTIAALS